ncbi:dnaJ homolog subfamily C member 13-like [Paramuricea clavata]|uniref:DnaJ homolog subfamily C member 13-like n=1 Tax=Paramuricea clavata TaxID=317549 RepID=A0A7D9HW28_PARCT|nr:dnaJ homolog subfamily C member 13-like [Paramuricea clavata]
MQDLALAEGALPRHLHMAMFTQSSDRRLLMNRQLSRHLVGLWTTGHPTAMALLRRIMPAGLLYYLESPDPPPETEEDRLAIRDNVKLAESSGKARGSLRNQVEGYLSHWRTKIGFKSKKDINQKPVVLRNRKQNIKSEQNWDLFYYKFNKDLMAYNLIWNYKTREELRGALESEMRAFAMDKDLSGNYVVSWNHLEFEVLYECLSDELKIGDYYLRVLLEQNEEETPITNALEFFNDLYHRFLLTTKPTMKAMCLQAMTKVYGKCHEEIGAFNDTKYIVGMLDRTSDKLERDRLLFFLNDLTKHQRNVKALLDVNAIKGLVELMTLCHLHTSRATVPLQTNLLEAAPDSGLGGEKEWYYGNKEKERLGPFSFDEMKDFGEEEAINPSTRCWCQGMDGWRPLQHIPQLKWFLLAEGTPLMNETDMAVLILNMLIRICSYYPNRDFDGAIVRPLPRAKRMLSEASCLPHIVQLLLTFDPIIVEKVSVLLNDILLDNPVIPRLYLTGVFYFIMMYTGSNLLPIGKFLSETHMKQSFRSEQNQGGEISQRSILGSILPEAMICYLENHGCDKFSSIFLGEFDTPEAIWSSEMRRFMIGKIASHLADFSPRLRSNTKALYQYCPIPVISYPQLEYELFCNIYYLRHLCDTQRFPDWPIKEPVKFLKELLEAWKSEVEKKPPDLSVEQALKILNLKKKPEEYDEAKIRKAYFRMAQKYHPDKNPEGRDIFEQVSKAYDFLCSRSSRKVLGPDPRNIILILRAQSILFSRCKEVLEPYKYSGYPMLIKTIQMEIEDAKAFSKETALLPSACELCYHTVNTSALNAEELRRENGIEILQAALSRAIDLIGSSSKPGDIPVQVCCHIVHCYAVASQFEKCREKIAEMQIIVQELCRLLYYKNLPGMCILSSECVSNFAVDFWLQTHLLQAGVLWHLLLFMFNYDYTLEEGGVESSAETNQQEIANELARKSVRAVARLGGYLEGEDETPENPATKKSLDAMLTPYLARKLHNSTPQELLKLLNSNTENPNLIWDNGTRGEIMKYLGEEQERKISTGECDPSFGADFVFSVFEKELIIGEIFVRVYNDQPSYPLENPKKFASDLLNFIGNQAQYLHSLLQLQAASQDTTESGTQHQRFEHVAMALEALRNVIKASPGVEEKCIGQFKLIFSLLRMSEATKLQQLALEVISNVTGNKNCVSDIADSNVISYLLLTLYTLPSCRPLVTETLHALCSNTKIVKEAHSKGALVYLLDLFCNSTNPSVRAKAAELFNKMMADKLVGPKVKITLSKFLPTIFMDAMRENTEVSVHMFEGMHENPELVWNDESREKVCNVIKKERNRFYNKQKDDPDASWKLPDDFEVVYSNVEGELVVGGVYLNLFIAQPHWVLRKPKEFLLDLMDKYAALLRSSSPDGQLLETFTQAVVSIFTVQPALADQMPSLGHLPVIFKCMKSTNDAIPRSAIQVIHILSSNEFCVRSLSEVDVVRPMIAAMDARPDIIVLACEALHQMFDQNQSGLVDQAVKAELVQYLLKLLDTDLKVAYKIENAPASKAQIVKALKAMSRDFLHGEKVLEILDKSEVWASYRDQKHDLFISDRNVAGYLTGPMGVAGYLTQGAANSNAMPNKPPPIESILDDD